METVALIGPIPQLGRQIFRRELGGKFHLLEIESEHDYEKLASAEYAVLRTLSLGAEHMDMLPRMKLIQRWGAGCDTVDIRAAGGRGIQVAVTPGMNAGAVSEYAVLLMLAVNRHLIQVHDNVKSGRWRDNSLINTSYTLKDQVVGLIGLGNIGRQVVKKVQAFGAGCIYYDVRRLPEEEEQRLGIRYTKLEELPGEADIVSVHVPLTDATRNLIDGRWIARMKPDAILVNTSRGGIIDEQALYEALAEKRIRGAGLDVWDQEPPAQDHPLFRLDQVVFSSHFGGNTIDISLDTAMCCVENIRKAADGQRLAKPFLVNDEYLN